MAKVLLLGAGSSYGTLSPLAPTAELFGGYLRETLPNWETEFPYLHAAVEYFSRRIPGVSQESWGLDKVWSSIDNRVKLRNIFDGNLSLPSAPTSRPTHRRIYSRIVGDDFGAAGFELKCAIARVYGDDIERIIDPFFTK